MYVSLILQSMYFFILPIQVSLKEFDTARGNYLGEKKAI